MHENPMHKRPLRRDSQLGRRSPKGSCGLSRHRNGRMTEEHPPSVFPRNRVSADAAPGAVGLPASVYQRPFAFRPTDLYDTPFTSFYARSSLEHFSNSDNIDLT